MYIIYIPYYSIIFIRMYIYIYTHDPSRKKIVGLTHEISWNQFPGFRCRIWVPKPSPLWIPVFRASKLTNFGGLNHKDVLAIYIHIILYDVYIYIYNYICVYYIYKYDHIWFLHGYIWVSYNDLTATSLWSWLVRGIIPKIALFQVSELQYSTHTDDARYYMARWFWRKTCFISIHLE